MTWTWNFNLDEAPRGYMEIEQRLGRAVEVYHYVTVILASRNGGVVKSRWLPQDDRQRRPIGRWEGFSATGDDPVAWMPWPDPPPTRMLWDRGELMKPIGGEVDD